MFLIDDILLAPAHGILWIFREIRNAAQQEQDGESESITAELTELYMMLETGKITEGEFDASERVLLDRLDAIRESHGATGENGEDEGCEQDEEDESAHE
jgi:hypothetical protein